MAPVVEVGFLSYVRTIPTYVSTGIALMYSTQYCMVPYLGTIHARTGPGASAQDQVGVRHPGG